MQPIANCAMSVCPCIPAGHPAGCSRLLILQTELAQADLPGRSKAHQPHCRTRAEGEGEMIGRVKRTVLDL
jgi:hypothetical protein